MSFKKAATLSRKPSLGSKELKATPESSDDHRVFQNSVFGSYTSPKMKTSIKDVDFGVKPKQDKKAAVFLGPNGSFYDIQYMPADKSPLTNGNQAENGSSATHHPDINAFPQPEQFESYFDYEQALLDWKLTIETALSGVRLPNVMGRKFSRPKVDDQKEQKTGSDMLIGELDEDRRKSSDIPTADGGPDGKGKEEQQPPTVLDEDPWDALLVPQEPQPTDYDTFSEYEDALVRWAHLCSSIAVLPPHASQLKDMIPIQVKQEVPEVVSTSASQSQGDETEVKKWKVRTGFREPMFFEQNVLFTRSSAWNTTPVVVTNLPPIKEFRQLPPPVKARAQKIITDMLQAQNDKLSKYGSYNAPLLPVIHGTLPKPWEQQRNSGTNANKITIRNTKYRTLRRTDLTGPMISSCMDCPGEVSGNKVDFNTPEFDIDNLDLQRLATDPTYLEQTTKTLVHLQHYDRHDHLNSWFHPHISQEVHNKHREYINYLIMSTPAHKFDVSVLCDILSGDMFLDKFQDLLGETCREEEDGSSKSYLQLFIGCVTPDNFPDILALFENGNSPLLHAKLSTFISETAQSAKGKILFERLIVNRDIKSLSFVAYAITYFSEVQVDVFPWHMDAYWSVKRFLGESVEPLLVVFCFYYVNMICQAINKQPFLFVGLSYFINDAKKGLATQLGQVLQKFPDFVGKYVFQGIASRLQTISQTFLFVMVQLLTQQNQEAPLVQVCLRSEETDLVSHIKELTDSKYLHVQLAARRLFAIISCEPWQDFLFAEYSNNPDQFVKDLCHAATNTHKQSLLSLLTLDMAKTALDKVNATEQSRKRVSFMMDEALFHTFVQQVIRTKQIDATTQTITALLAQLAKTYLRLNLISPTLNVKTSQKRTGNLSLTLSPSDLQKMLFHINDVSGSDVVLVNAVKRNWLMMFRRLVKADVIFEFVRKETEFYTRLHGFCREGTLPQLEFNREAWKMLYQIVFRHYGTMEHMVKTNWMQPVIELVTFSPNVVVMHGLNCLTKMFSMLTEEQTKPKRKDLKTVEKDINHLSKLFINRRLIVKAHMIFKKFTQGAPGTTVPSLTHVPGATFTALANFYNTLQTNPGCAKLKKDTDKTDYKEGLIFFNNMYNPPVLAEENNGSPTPGAQKKPANNIQSVIKKPFLLSRSASMGSSK